MKKIITIILAVIGVISIVLLGRVISTGDTVIQSAAKAGGAENMDMIDGLFNPYATVAYIVLGAVLLLVVFFMLKGIFTNPANLKRTLMGVGAFLLLLAICYFAFAKGVETPMQDNEVLSANGSKWVGAGLYMFYALAIIAGGAMLFTGIKKMIK